MAQTPVILIIAGTDSSGGAGITRDIETAVVGGVSTALAITSITAQTHDAVLHAEPVAPWLIAQQIASAFAANAISAVKIGMLGTTKAVKTVAATLKKYNSVSPIIFDPVLISSSKGALSSGNMRGTIVHDLLPITTLITPNLLELAELTLSESESITCASEAIEKGKILIHLGAKAVLIKGGHASGDISSDHLLKKNQALVSFSQKRLAITMRGTGCALSTAIASNLAKGFTLNKAVENANQYVFDLLRVTKSRNRKE
ncbi:MAG: hydroxymethylpyrimidine/phosphomethylpyrimidine kinase [Candidatus Tokpelaia sp. JSC188]|nr:MAG: hydroxymethylpyrimidine/phosphomethylpyrimidine kinase [Candidatus Tokpelaia sp. JSC188]